MNDSYMFMILLQVVLIALNAVFACAEIAIISMNDSKLAKLAAEGNKRAIKLARLTSQPARFLATIQVAITLSGFLGSAFAAENFSDGLTQWVISLGVNVSASTLEPIAVIFITLVLSYFTLVFGELVPKRIAMRKAESLALGLASLVSTIAKIFSPIIWFLTASTNIILRLFGIDPTAVDDEVSEEEIRMLVDLGSEKGAIDHEEKQFIQNVFEFDDITSGEILTHRTKIAMLWLKESMTDWENTIHNNRHTLYPICDNTADQIVGILNAKDYFRLEDKSRESVMKACVKPAYFVPDRVKADVLFRNMKHNNSHMAVVLDEYGGMSGIVTMNDLVEQLVGELSFDTDEESFITPIEVVSSETWKIHGSTLLEDVSKELGISLPCETYDTFNGLIFGALQTIPPDGTSIDVQTAGLIIKVREIRNHKVEVSVVSLDIPKETTTTQEQTT